MAGCRSAHIAQNNVRLAARLAPNLFVYRIVMKIPDDGIHTTNGIEFQQIDCDDRAFGANSFRRYLAPTTGRCAKVNDLGATPKKAILGIDIDQLKSCTAPIANPFRLLDIRIIELALQPTRRGIERPRAVLTRCLASARLGPLRPRRATAPAYSRPSRLASASRINSIRIPSRTPRSATRMRPTVQRRMIASSTAQPATTSFARSLPIHGCAARSSGHSPNPFADLHQFVKIESQAVYNGTVISGKIEVDTRQRRHCP